MIRVLVFGAHPDDCDVLAGGSAALWRQRGDAVRFVSVTCGDAGHQSQPAPELAARRRDEARRAGAVLDVEYEVLDHPDGLLTPTLDRRLEVIRQIREYRPDLVLTHRPNDYHPDHRAVSVLVQDASYLVTVPKICPEVPHLERDPVIAYLYDSFKKPTPFSVDVAVAVDTSMEKKWLALHQHTSQFYEWLPFNDGSLADVPDSDSSRRQWLENRWAPHLAEFTGACRERLVQLLGVDRASSVRFAEAFELCEYGVRPGDSRAREELATLFPVE